MAAIRQNFPEECEASINKQINMELEASYVYMAMASYFAQSDIAFPGHAKFFSASSEEERGHADKLIKYQSLRGGRTVFKDIKAPEAKEWEKPVHALEDALKLERAVNDSLLKLKAVADEKNDAHLCDFLEDEFISGQVDSLKQLGDLITMANRCGDGLGAFEFDKMIGDASP